MGFLVDDRLDEGNYLRYILNKDRLSPLALTTYVVFSTICNFRCVYCYEDGQTEQESMDENMVEQLVKWYKQKLEKGSFEICSVDLYGGEPLLQLPLVFCLLTKLKDVTHSLGVRLKCRLITNGYLLTTDIVEKLIDLGLDAIHVTIDGLAEVHDSRRMLKNGRGTFDRVFRNLIEIAQIQLPLEIACRVSFDKANVKQILVLLDYIKRIDGTGKIDPYFAPVTQTLSHVNIPESFCCNHVLAEEEITENTIFLYSEAVKRGFNAPEFFALGPCMVVAKDGVVIAPDGAIYKCLDMIGRKDLMVGNIFSERYEPLYYDFIDAPLMESCLNTNCPFVPVCGGGCVMESLLKHQDYRKLICHRTMLEKIYKGLLPLQF